MVLSAVVKAERAVSTMIAPTLVARTSLLFPIVSYSVTSSNTDWEPSYTNVSSGVKYRVRFSLKTYLSRLSFSVRNTILGIIPSQYFTSWTLIFEVKLSS